MKKFNNDKFPHYSRNKGATTLLMAVVLGFLIILITVFASKVGIMEQKTSANDARYKEAFNASEAGLEDAMRYIKHNKSSIEAEINVNGTYSHALTDISSDGTSTLISGSYSATITANSVDDPITIESNGFSADSSGESSTQILVSYFSPFGDGDDIPDVPFITGGTATLGGSLQIIGNSNGAGTGVPVSVWAHDVISLSGSMGTCQLDGYLVNGSITPNNDADKQLCEPTNCSCNGTIDASESSTTAGKGADIVDSDPYVADDGNFPDDLFEYVFGTSRNNWKEIYDFVAVDGHILANCSSLDANSEGIYWIEGDCTILSNQIVGNMDDPDTTAYETRAVIIIIEEGQAILRGGATVFGLVYSFDKDDNGTTDGIDINGNAIVYGLLIADTGINISNGTLHIRYNRHILNALFSDTSEDGGGSFGGNCGGTSGICDVGRVAGTWRDF